MSKVLRFLIAVVTVYLAWRAERQSDDERLADRGPGAGRDGASGAPPPVQDASGAPPPVQDAPGAPGPAQEAPGAPRPAQDRARLAETAAERRFNPGPPGAAGVYAVATDATGPSRAGIMRQPGDIATGHAGAGSHAAARGRLKLDAGQPKGAVSKLKAIWGLIRDAISAWIDDYAPSMGAAISYYTLFSLAPLMLIIISVAGLVFGQEAAQGELFGQLRGLLGDEGATAVEGLLQSVELSGKGALGTIVSVVLLGVGATTVFAELQSALDRIWRSPAREEASGIWSVLRSRLLSFGLILALGFLLIVSLVMSAALSALGQWYSHVFGGWEWLAQIANFLVSFGLITVIFAMIYKIMPRVDVAWHDVWIGAAVTSLLFAIGKFAIGMYIGTSGIASGFGAASSIVVLLVWVYYSAQIFLVGAEFTWVFANRYGSRRTSDSLPGGPVAGGAAGSRPVS